MSYIKKKNIIELINFSKDQSYMGIVERDIPKDSKLFFQSLLQKPVNTHGIIRKNQSLIDIKNLLDKVLSKDLKDYSFYDVWIKDIEQIVNIFYKILDENSLRISIETSRNCKRYHIDNVPMRLLVTYYGKGTEWLPDYASDYSAYFSGQKNEKIVKNKKKIKFLKPWDVAVFKGQKFRGLDKGILHRTPDDALNGNSILMRLDSAKFLTDIFN